VRNFERFRFTMLALVAALATAACSTGSDHERIPSKNVAVPSEHIQAAREERDDLAPLTDAADAGRITLCDPPAVHTKFKPLATLSQLGLNVHRIRRDDGSGGVTDSDLAAGIARLNEAFEPMNLAFTVLSIADMNDSGYFDIDSREERFAMLHELSAAGNGIDLFFVNSLYGNAGAATFAHYEVQGIAVRK
jgi:hypothetical protein